MLFIGVFNCFFAVFKSQGLNFLIPVVDTVHYVQSLKEIAIDIPQQSAITAGLFDLLKFLQTFDSLHVKRYYQCCISIDYVPVNCVIIIISYRCCYYNMAKKIKYL